MACLRRQIGIFQDRQQRTLITFSRSSDQFPTGIAERGDALQVHFLVGVVEENGQIRVNQIIYQIPASRDQVRKNAPCLIILMRALSYFGKDFALLSGKRCIFEPLFLNKILYIRWGNTERINYLVITWMMNPSTLSQCKVFIHPLNFLPT